MEVNNEVETALPLMVWWDGKNEKFGLLNINNGLVEEKGTIGDMKWWSASAPCVKVNNNLIVMGIPEDDNSSYIYTCDILNGNLLDKTPIAEDNFVIAGYYKEKIVVIWWDGNNEKFGFFYLDGSVEIIGNVGDLKYWSSAGPSLIIGNKLIAIGIDGESNKNIYVCSIDNGNLIKKIKLNNETNMMIAGEYNDEIVVVWWDGSNEKFGLFNIEEENLTIKGNIGDMKWWSGTMPCKVVGNKLIVVGFPEETKINGESNQKLYLCDIEIGILVDKFPLSGSYVNVAFPN